MSQTPPNSPKRRLLVPIALLALLLAVGFGVWSVRSRRLPTLTQERLDEAQAAWKSGAPENYFVRVEVRGMQPGIYEVTVENHLAVSASFDGRPLRHRRTFGTWAVMGMFATLQTDMDSHDKHGHLLLGAEFDEQWGYPKEYQRIEMRTGAHDALEWTVTAFEVRP